MDMSSEVKVKIEEQLCDGCLSVDRRASPLGDLLQMYYRLVGTSVNKDTIIFCWECTAILRKVYLFQIQIQNAQTMLNLHSLSTLSTVTKDYYDYEIDYDNFIKEAKNETVWDDNDFDDRETKDNENTTDYNKDTIDKEKETTDNERTDTDKTTKTDKKKNYSWKNIKKEYKSYAKHIKQEWKKPYEQYFTKVELDEAEIEEHFLIKDRKRQGHKMNYKCQSCSLIYGRKIDLDRHNDLNHYDVKVNSYKCTHCSKRLPSLPSLSRHWRSHASFYRCVACSALVFPRSAALHLSRCHVNVYKCTSCTLSFSSLVSFSEHYNKNHPFICDYCEKRCALKSVLEKHIETHHIPQHCDICARAFDNNKLYRAHCRVLHPAPAEPAMCYCVECDRQFPSRPLYNKHVSSKHAVKKQTVKSKPCPECGKAFAKNSDMLLHYNFSHVKITKYHCELCDKYFLKRYGLRTHMESVHLKLPKPKNKICDLCGRAFQSKSVLENHRRTHTGERPYRCGACGAAFAQRGAARLHQRRQHPPAPSSGDGGGVVGISGLTGARSDQRISGDRQ